MTEKFEEALRSKGYTEYCKQRILQESIDLGNLIEIDLTSVESALEEDSN